MLNGECNENGTIFSNQQKKKQQQICTCSTLFVFLCRCFAQLQRCFVGLKPQTSNFLVTHYFYGGSRIFVCAYPIFCLLCSCSLLFFTAAHFHLAGRQHFSLSHSRFEFPCFSSTKFVSFVFNHSLQLLLCYPRDCKHQKYRRKRQDFVVVFTF